jgi:hypothetical protein
MISSCSHETQAAHIVDHRRLGRLIDLTSQPPHMHVDQVILWDEFVIKDLFQQIPDVLLQPHSAPLGLAFNEGSQFPATWKGDDVVASGNDRQTFPRPAPSQGLVRLTRRQLGRTARPSPSPKCALRPYAP